MAIRHQPLVEFGKSRHSLKPENNEEYRPYRGRSASAFRRSSMGAVLYSRPNRCLGDR
ncbi:hypothetical protein SMJ63A_50083 [Stenotrophomonas geniculata]